jgi:Rap1a immunity proteins
MMTVAAALGLGAPHAEEQRARETFKVGEEATSLISMNVTNLRDAFCGGEHTQGNQDAKNAKFIGCVMFVLGVVDMLREWQRIDPVHAPPVCVPRAVTAGGLIIVVQDYIEATTPWRAERWDATPAVIAALKTKRACPPNAR